MPKSFSNLIFEINEALSFSALPSTLLLMERKKKTARRIKKCGGRKGASLLMNYNLGLLLTVMMGLGILILAHRSHKIRQ